jgi:hypothetical protein
MESSRGLDSTLDTLIIEDQQKRKNTPRILPDEPDEPDKPLNKMEERSMEPKVKSCVT